MTPALVFWADPGHQWHRRAGFANRELKPGEVWLLPGQNVDDRDLRIAQFQTLSRIDLLFLGSSRVASAAMQDYFTADLRFYYAGVISAEIQDYVAFWQFLKETHKLPRAMVIYLDPWAFNRHVRFGIWERNREFVERFSGTEP